MLCQLDDHCVKDRLKVAWGMQKEISFKLGRGQEPISYLSIKLSHTHVEMNKMCLTSISVVISFPKIIYEIEHYMNVNHGWFTQMRVHADVWDKTSNFFHFLGGGGWHKTIWISIFIPHITFWMVLYMWWVRAHCSTFHYILISTLNQIIWNLQHQRNVHAFCSMHHFKYAN